MRERLTGIIKREIAKRNDALPASATEFSKEVGECIHYFEGLKHNKRSHLKLRISGRVEIGRIEGELHKFYLSQNVLHAVGFPPYKAVYTVENGILTKNKIKISSGESLGQENVTKGELKDLVDKIHTITLPYAQHVQHKKVHD